MKKGVIVVAVALVAIALGVYAVLTKRDEPRSAVVESWVDPDTMRIVPESVRVRVEVLNASGQRGLARRATQYLRDRGFDVVSVGNAATERDSSVILDRSDHPDWAAWAARAVGKARIERQPDSTRYLDLTVILGRSFRSPSQILYP